MNIYQKVQTAVVIILNDASVIMLCAEQCVGLSAVLGDN